jgi:hypothetical protein
MRMTANDGRWVTGSEEEEHLLVAAHKRLGNKWADIAREIAGR